VVNNLLYLPETRRLIAWDTDLQTNLQMLLNQDLIPGADFAKRRQDLTRLDSARRHKHVAVGKIQERLDRFHGASGKRISKSKSDEAAVEYQAAIEELQRIGRESLDIDREVSKVSAELSELSNEIEEIREKADVEEGKLILKGLSEHEHALNLALEKLVDLGICPACGTKQKQLQAAARLHAKNHSCVLCGSNIEQGTNAELSTLRSRLSEKLRAKKAIESDLMVARARLEHNRAVESNAQRKVNQIRFSQPDPDLASLLAPAESAKDLARLRNRLVAEEADYAAQIETLSRQLERQYERFRRSAASRAAQLKATYQKYATDFLGVPCELIEAEGDIRLLNLMRFIPKFDGVERASPNSCSEAQRFFLDIAFRMALIDVASTLNESRASFLCETPETALDLTYVENVVSMLTRFGDEGHNCLYTVNVQEGGIGEQLLAVIPARERPSHILNLIEIGNLSTVQKQKRAKIDRAVGRMMR
jgi:hypothetical protein